MARNKTNVRQQQFGFPDEDLKTSLHDEIVLWLKGNSWGTAKRLLGWTEEWDAHLVEAKRDLFRKAVEQQKAELKREISELDDFVKQHRPDHAFYGLQHRENSTGLPAIRNYLSVVESLDGPGVLPSRELEVKSFLEVPITRERFKATDIIGYADIVFSIRESILLEPSFPVSRKTATSDLERFQKERFKWGVCLSENHQVALDAKSTIPSLGQLIRDLKTYRVYCPWPFYVVSPEARFAEAIADEGFGFIQYPEGVFLQPRKSAAVQKSHNPG